MQRLHTTQHSMQAQCQPGCCACCSQLVSLHANACSLCDTAGCTYLLTSALAEVRLAFLVEEDTFASLYGRYKIGLDFSTC